MPGRRPTMIVINTDPNEKKKDKAEGVWEIDYETTWTNGGSSDPDEYFVVTRLTVIKGAVQILVGPGVRKHPAVPTGNTVTFSHELSWTRPVTGSVTVEVESTVRDATGTGIGPTTVTYHNIQVAP